MRRRILAALLAGIMVFSQTGTAFAAQNAEVADTAVEASAEEEPEAEAAVVEEPEKPEEAKEPEVAPAEVAPAEGTSAEGTENEAPSADERQDEVTTEEEPEEAEAAGTVEGSEASSTEEATVEEPGEGSTEEVAAETDETVEEPEEEVAGKEAKKEDEHWSIELDPEDAPDGNDYWSVFTDATLEIGYRNLIVPEGAEYEMAWYVGTGGWDDAGRRFDGYNLAQNDSWHLNGDKIMLDGTPLWHKGIRRIEVRVAVFSEGEEYCAAQMGFDVEESFMEQHWNFGTRTLLPGRDQWINRGQGGYVQNKQHPWGDRTGFTVTNVQVEDVQGQDVVIIEDENEEGWNLRAENGGESRVTVTYTDEDGIEGTYEFTLYVADDVYEVDVWSNSGSDRVLPGKTVDMTAQAWHDYVDPNTGEHRSCSEEELAGITYSWRLDYYDDYAEEQLGDYITITVDDNDPRHASVSFANIPDSWDDNLELNVIVTIEENGITAENNYWLHMRNQYLELWPTGIDGNIEVGDEIPITPELREYPADNEAGYDILPSDQVRFEAEVNDGRAYSIDDSVPGSFVVKRLKEYGSSFRIKAFVKNEQGDYEEVDNREYWFNHKDYNIWFYGHDVRLYTDAETSPELELSTENLGNGWEDRLDVEIQAGHWDRNHWGEMLGDGDYTVTTTGGTLKVALTNAYLQSVDDYEDIRVVAEVYPKNVEQTDDSRISETDAWFHIQQAREEYDREWDRTMLPGWDGTVKGSYEVYIENSEYPEGHNENYSVTNVEIISDVPASGESGKVVELERDQKSDDDYWWYYRVSHRGEATLKVTYEDIHGQEQSYEFTLHVNEDVYEVDIWSDSGSDRVLPGKVVDLTAQARHKVFDPVTEEEHSCSEEEMAGITYSWRLDNIDDYADGQLRDLIRLSVDENDHRHASVSFADIPDDWDEEVHLNVVVTIEENGITAENNYWLHMRDQYLELWPTRIDDNIEVGEETTITPELREYPADNEDGYEVLPADQVRFEVETYDDRAYSIDDSVPGTFIVKRLQNYGSSFRIKAFVKNEWGDDEEVDDREYWFNHKDYNIWFYEHDVRLYTDAETLPELELSTENLGDGWENRLDVEIQAGHWDRNHWG